MYSKYHGCGNDFILGLYDENIDYSKFSFKYCNRYTGLGADGVILAKPTNKEDIKYEMVFYNADGSRAPMCGNGIRCFCKFLYDEKLEVRESYKVDTLSGVMHVKVESFEPFYVTINLGKPDYSVKRLDIDFNEDKFIDQNIEVNGKIFNVSCVYMATHHLVAIVDNIDLVTEEDGRGLCFYEKFTKQINVNFVEIIDRENIKLKTYERGVGFTKACGTGGAASFVVLMSKNLIENHVKNHLEFGVLKYNIIDEEIYMTGPSEKICSNIKFY